MPKAGLDLDAGAQARRIEVDRRPPSLSRGWRNLRPSRAPGLEKPTFFTRDRGARARLPGPQNGLISLDGGWNGL